MKKLMTFITFLMLSFTLFAQNSITIGPVVGAGNASYISGPIYRFSTAQVSKFTRFAHLYTKDEINIPAGSIITQIEWKKYNAASCTGNNKFIVSIGNTLKSILSTNSMPWSQLKQGTTEVFNSSKYELPITGNYPLSIPFNQEFVYDGNGLIVLSDFSVIGACTGPMLIFNKSAIGKSLFTASNTDFNLVPADQTLIPTSGSSRPSIKIYFTPPIICNSAPDPGNIVTNITNPCPGKEFSLSLSNKIKVGNIVYSWERSNTYDFITYETISNTPSITITQTKETFYRCRVSCGELYTFTPIYDMRNNDFYNCYAPSSAQSTADEEIIHFKFGSLDNYSICGEKAFGLNSSPYLYSNYNYITPPNIELGSTVLYTVETNVCRSSYIGGYPNQFAIYLDLNRNGIYESNELISSSIIKNGNNIRSGILIIPLIGQSGLTGLRVIVTEQSNPTILPFGVYPFGETEDYLVNLVEPVNCTTINPGKTLASKTSICYGDIDNLYIENDLIGKNIMYQWYKNDSIIPQANSFFYNPVITYNSSYKCRITCNDSTIYSTPVDITITPFTDCYCSSRPNTDADAGIFSFTLNGVKTKTLCGSVAGPGSVPYIYQNYKTKGVLTDLSDSIEYTYDVEVDDCDQAPYYSSSVGIWIDFNHNGSFEDAGEKVAKTECSDGPKHVIGTFKVPYSALKGITGMRVTVAEGLCYFMYNGVQQDQLKSCAQFGSGEVNDYLINIK